MGERGFLKSDLSVGLMSALGGFATLSIGDALVKSTHGAWPATGMATIRYGVAALGLGILLAMREGRAGFVPRDLGWNILRALGSAVAVISFFSAVQLMPLAEATSISFTSPMITAFLGAALLREPVRKATVIASVIALAGVVIVLRPNFAHLGVAALLPLSSATGMALLMVANRAIAGRSSALATQFTVSALTTPILIAAAIAGHLSGVPSLHIGLPPVSVALKSSFIAFSASVAHYLIYKATTRAGAGAIAPMSYAQLLMALFFGAVFFSSVPDLTALGGAALIVAAGIFLWRDGLRAHAPAEIEASRTD